MQTQDDEFPYTSEDPSLAPAEEAKKEFGQKSQQVSDLKAALRLAVGSGLTGTDVFTTRLRRMRAMQETVTPQTIKIDEDETSRNALIYAWGFCSRRPTIERRLKAVDHSSSKVFGFFSKLISPFTESWIFNPVKDQYDHAVARGEKVVNRLIMKGRVEEQNSRQMLQQKAIDDLINEFVEYLVLKIKVQRLLSEAPLAGM
jgi:hypothetical protein